MATWLAGQIQVDMAAGQDGERLSTTFHLHRCKTGRKPAAQRGTFLANRIAELARHKSCKSVWATTPCRKLAWGNQELIRPLTYSALGAVPSERIEVLAKPKRDFSALDTRRAAAARTGGDIGVSETPRPSCRAAQYQHVVRLSTPKSSCRVLEGRSAHTAGCEHNCPIWHTETRGRVTEASPRITQLATPRTLHPHFQWNQDVSAFPPPSSSSHSAVPGVSSVSSGQLVVTRVSHAARTARLTPRLEQLSEPRTRDGGMFFERGRPEQPIRPVGPFRLGPHVPEARRALMSPSSTFAGFPSGEDRQSVPARQQPVLTQAAHEGLRPQPGAGRVHSGTPAASIMEVNAPLLLLFS
ncbi:ADP-ribosylation factor-like protein 9 isoform X3 [Denticeps clupeoides]|uniref:ADP-ribosylation factor-like protein 9 isoform X3 n=1 Tax=Denticeps clupeoides TaxID=299321 RepID=UPI0010A5305E|nr:ADP-ribosylation factor-like protein 9 isoform X3 [Denticeps clupeoides]